MNKLTSAKSLKKYSDMHQTASGDPRAFVELNELETLWFNSGTKCNLTCEHCYIESSPTNDRLEYISTDEVQSYLEEIRVQDYPVKLIGITGGEPFLNPHIMEITSQVLKQGFEILILTNALRVIDRHIPALIKLKDLYADKLHLRVSLDHHTQEIHEKERGSNSFYKCLENVKRLVDSGLNISIAGRSLTDENIEQAKKSYQILMADNDINFQSINEKIVVFPEMDLNREVPEISVKCWDILGKSPSSQMCSSERMIVKRKGDTSPTVLPCTLIAYDQRFDLGKSLSSAQKKVYLNHKFCAQFCVLGEASCSSTK